MRPRSEKLNVLFEDNHLLVVNKPPLLPTMGVKEGELSLLSQSRQYIKKKYNKPGNVYLGIVSRLDAFVSGVIVLAKTSKAAGRLSEQFRNRTADKTYWAIIPDALKEESGRLEDWVIKNESLHRMTVIPKGKKSPTGAKVARLNYKTIGTEITNRQCPTKLLEIKLETGRKHQIRVQLENAGASILGDRKYGSDLPFKRGIALHSRELSIEHPTNRVLQSFQAETPSWWNIDRYSLS
ncbi:RluA family pseudouridine synthase [Mariniblastus sp.]|jgi:23S rRNA pseudouridine1911/1915/1917 synthase|nr:RluA family pseudouridine synthase [Mariniblastus sp.]MDC0284492.1 RluA family pseudouridine synthase [Mariniblastus sp.]|eukprot:COSAG01_NODE_850_length_13122_cov_10.883821_2_plen_238_part_00